VNADGQNSQNQIQWQLISGSFGGLAMATDDFFRARLDGMVDPRHPLAVLGRRMPWLGIEARLASISAGCCGRCGASCRPVA